MQPVGSPALYSDPYPDPGLELLPAGRMTARLGCDRLVTRLPAINPGPGDPAWIAVEAREINVIPLERPVFERTMPKPPEPARDRVLSFVPDSTLGELLQKPGTSLAWYHAQLRKRARAKAAGQIFRLPALRPTLENMRLFLASLLAGDQFAEPLTASERRALERVDREAERLLADRVPYRRTVLLSFVFGALYELLVQTRILRPENGPLCPLSDLLSFCFAGCDESGNSRKLRADAIDPELVVSCFWGGLNPGGPDETCCLLDGEFFVSQNLCPLLDNEELLLYPSWQPLDLLDFCRFGHLPVYPIGLITDYAANADGLLHTPLQFMVHDLAHVLQGETFRHLRGVHPLEKPDNRCAFRQLVLDNLPAPLAPWHLHRALVLLVFELLHEASVVKSMRALDEKGFVRLMLVQARARREHWYHYSASYQGITDRQGAAAALWIHRLFGHWQASDLRLSGRQLDAFARQFVAQELTQLQWHLEYVEQHRASLRELFFAEAEEMFPPPARADDANRRLVCPGALFLNPFADSFFHWKPPHNDGCIDHCDVLYFDRLHQGGGAALLERATGSSLLYRKPL